jgi:HPt (histidine-containing phosphotransfer) domain-containing protein
MDCQMPEMDGFKATQAIRTMQKAAGTPPVPILALTALAMKGDKERCLEAGMNDYIAKPIRKEQLKTALEKWLGAASPIGASSTAMPLPATSEVESESASLDLRVIDEVRELMGEKFLPVVQLFLNDTRNHLGIIDHELEVADHKGNIDEIMRAAHSLRAACGHIGANRMADAAAALEDAARGAKEGQAADLAALHAVLKKNFDQAQRELEPLLGSRPAA